MTSATFFNDLPKQMTFSLSTRRLILRPLKPEDADLMFRYRSRPVVWRYQIWRPEDISEIHAFIEKQKVLLLDTPGTWFSLAITRRESGEMVGDLGMHFPEEENSGVEIGITLDPEYQKRGYAAEALDAAFRFLFFSLGKDRVYASVDPRNTASIRLLEGRGMRKVSCLTGSLVIRGERVDDYIYALRRDEYPDKPR
jgi:RimJ/RimL family protein N-acetyltransferase